MTPESPRGEPPSDLDLDALTGVASEIRHESTQEFGPDYTSMQDWAKRMDYCIDLLRSRLRTQRERLEKVRDMLMVVTRQAELTMEPRRNEDFETMDRLIAANLEAVAALDTILKEEG